MVFTPCKALRVRSHICASSGGSIVTIPIGNGICNEHISCAERIEGQGRPEPFQQQLKIEQQGKMLKTTGRSVKEPFLPLTKMRKDLPKFETV